jgi:hypothetical protein
MKRVERDRATRWSRATPRGLVAVTLHPWGGSTRRNDGQFHREGGPASINPDGYSEWWDNGDIHREDGPAIVRPEGTREWASRGQFYS